MRLVSAVKVIRASLPDDDAKYCPDFGSGTVVLETHLAERDERVQSPGSRSR